MIVKYNGKSKDPDVDLVESKSYNVIAVESNWYRIIDESGEDYLYPPELFDVLEYNSED